MVTSPARMFCYFSVTAGDCVVLKDAAGETIKVKPLPIHYARFAARVLHWGSKRWSLTTYGPGTFHFTRKT